MSQNGFRLTAARADGSPLGGPGALALGSLAAGVLCLLLAALAA